MPKLRTNWSIQMKEWGYGKFHGVLSTGYPRSRTKGKEAGETVDHKGYWGSLIRNSHLFGSRWAIFQGRHLHERASVSLRPCRPLGQTKWVLRQQYHGIAYLNYQLPFSKYAT